MSLLRPSVPLPFSSYGDIEAVEDFLSIGKSPNEADGDGRVPLHFACGFGHGAAGEAVVSALLEAKADVNAADAKVGGGGRGSRGGAREGSTSRPCMCAPPRAIKQASPSCWLTRLSPWCVFPNPE